MPESKNAIGNTMNCEVAVVWKDIIKSIRLLPVFSLV